MARSWSPERNPVRLRAVGVTVAISLGALGAGVGGYLVGSSSGGDLTEAREAGAAAGQEQGAAQGAEEAYARVFERARERGFADTYADAYQAAYRSRFRTAGIDAPATVSVPDPGATEGNKG